MISNKDWYDRVFRDERAWVRKLKPYFNNEPTQLLKVIEDSVNLESIAPKVHESFNTEALEPIYTDLYLSQGVKYYNLLQNAVQKELKRKLSKEQIQAILWQNFARVSVATRIKTIVDNSRGVALAVIRRTIQQGYVDGLGVQEIKRNLERNVKKRWRDMAKFRSATIAKTETGNIANASTYKSAQDADVPMIKRWSAFIDDRTRDDHIEMDGTTVGKDEEFVLPDGSLMLHPSAEGGSAKQVINCRCRAVFDIDFKNI